MNSSNYTIPTYVEFWPMTMLDLLNQNNKGPQANKTTTAEDILSASQRNTVDESVKIGTIIAPEFTLQANTQHEANQGEGAMQCNESP